MANPDYSWPPMATRKHIGKRYRRLDGQAKASGRAKYSSDLNPKGLLHAVYVHNPYAHAKITSINTAEAEKMPGVKAVHVMVSPGTEMQWQGHEIAAVAATTEELARDAARAIKVEYEVLPHVVNEADLAKAGARARQAGENVQGEPDKALAEAEVVSEGEYGIAVINHCCLEPHGQVIQWIPGAAADGSQDQVNAWPSTQNMTQWPNGLATNIKVPAANIKVKMDYIGGGFGSKFAADAWGVVCANLSKKAGGAPVKLYLERAPEQMIAGNRPSAYSKIKVGGKKDGTITAWQSTTWGTGGFGNYGGPNVPYVYVNIPNVRRTFTNVQINAGAQRAWRAPGNQQASFLTCAALEDFAAKIGMDPLEVFKKNTNYTNPARTALYLYQLDKAAELAEWKKLWKPRGTSSAGPVKRGLGIGVAAWQGAGHACTARTVINPDGSVAVEMNTQDIGTGTRTVMTQVAAETLGLQMNQIKLTIGESGLPPGGSSGGSTTVGGVSSATRKSTMNALMKLFEAVAPSLEAKPEDLEAVDGRIRVKGKPTKFVTWQAGCRKLGTNPISEIGANVQGAQAQAEKLNTAGAGGAQIADVSVDTETGIIKVNRYVAVQDCGLVVNPKLSESQVYGAVIMGISTALFEERIIDNVTGKTLNPEMEFYKLAGIADIGSIIVHMDIRPENDSRGVVGLGEPPAVPICAAISNAVTNALGVRVPAVPITPERVLRALERKGES